MKPTEITINGKVFRTLEAVVYRLADQEPKSMDMSGYLPVVIDGDLKLWAIPGDLSPYALKSYVDEQDAKKQDIPIAYSLEIDVADWIDNTVQKAVESATDSNLIQWSAIAADIDAVAEAGIKMTAQTDGYVTFTCDETPSVAVHIIVVTSGVIEYDS